MTDIVIVFFGFFMTAVSCHLYLKIKKIKSLISTNKKLIISNIKNPKSSRTLLKELDNEL